MTQSEKVLEYIKHKGGISTRDAFVHLGITRLSARIYDLKKKGYRFKKIRALYADTRDNKLKHYDVYKLEDEPCENQ